MLNGDADGGACKFGSDYQNRSTRPRKYLPVVDLNRGSFTKPVINTLFISYLVDLMAKAENDSSSLRKPFWSKGELHAAHTYDLQDSTCDESSSLLFLLQLLRYIFFFL